MSYEDDFIAGLEQDQHKYYYELNQYQYKNRNMKTTITAVEKEKEYESKFGTMYAYKYTLADGTEGQASHKTDTPKYKVGDEVEVEIKGGEYGNKFKFITENNFTPKGKTGSNGSFALSYAKDLAVAQIQAGEGQMTSDQILALADKFNNWLNDKK